MNRDLNHILKGDCCCSILNVCQTKARPILNYYWWTIWSVRVATRSNQSSEISFNYIKISKTALHVFRQQLVKKGSEMKMLTWKTCFLWCEESDSEQSKFNFEGNQIVSEVIFRRAYWMYFLEKVWIDNFFEVLCKKTGRIRQGRFPRVFLKMRSKCSMELLAKSSFEKIVDLCTLLSKMSEKKWIFIESNFAG